MYMIKNNFRSSIITKPLISPTHVIISFILISITTIFTSTIYAEKAVILTFDDDWKGQYKYVKPILDKYGFKSTFFVTCNCLTYQNSTYCNNFGLPDYIMTWDNIKALQNEGHDIQSHGMSHIDLTGVSREVLDYEVGQSKQCLLDHGINSTIFANAYSAGWDNITVVKTVAKYYDMARNGYDILTYLKCDGWQGISNQTDCRTYFDNGTLTYANRYSIRVSDHNFLDRTYMHNETKILQHFIEAVNKQTTYNNEEINAVPIVVYHNVDYDQNIAQYPDHIKELVKLENTRENVSSQKDKSNETETDLYDVIAPYHIVGNSTTGVELFDMEMKYLHDNGFKVLTMDDLGYNRNSDHIYIKNIAKMQ